MFFRDAGGDGKTESKTFRIVALWIPDLKVFIEDQFEVLRREDPVQGKLL